MKLHPVRDLVHIRRDPENKMSTGGIVVTDRVARDQRPWSGVVLAIGPGKRDKDGKLIPIEVQVGDHVVFNQFTGHRYMTGRSEQDELMVSAEDILAVIEEE